MEEKRYIIYKHENLINHKIYIGQTCQKPERRWRTDGHGYGKTQEVFYNAIQKYGWDNFSHEIIEEGLTAEQANEREQYWIKYYDCCILDGPDKGYNMTRGGQSLFSRERWQDPKFRQKIYKSFSRARKKQWSDPAYAAAAQAKLQQGIQRVWHDPEWREKRIKAITGDKNNNAKAVQNIQTGKIFTTIKEAASWAGLNSVSGIGQCCRGKQHTAGHHPVSGQSLHWRFVQKGGE